MQAAADVVDGPPIAYSSLEERLAEFKAQYAEALPWQHLVIDEFLRQDVAERAAAAFPAPGSTKSKLAKLLGARTYEASIDERDPILRQIFSELEGPRFTRLLEQITGIEGLEADRELVGAGLHQGGQGSYLRIHADHNTHPTNGLRFRRINILIYLNRHWESQWNGDLELWDREAGSCEKKIEPRFNRCAILAVDDTAYHGYGPLRVPNGVTRNALAEYYYADVAAEGQTDMPHPTTLPTLRGEYPIIALLHRARISTLSRIEKAIRIASDRRR